MSSEEARKRSASRDPAEERVEWGVAAVSLLVVLGSVGYLGYKALTLPDTPPVIVTEVERVVPVKGGYVVEFWAKNIGGDTAGGLAVTGTLLDANGTPLEERETTITFVPSDSKRRAGFFFNLDPRAHELVIEPEGYDVP